MPSSFTLFGEIKIDSAGFQRALRSAQSDLTATGKDVTKLESNVRQLGPVTNTTSRQFEKFHEQLSQAKIRLNQTASAFAAGSATATQMRSALKAAETASERLTSRLKDMDARLADNFTRMQRARDGLRQFGSGSLDVAANVANLVTGVVNAGHAISNFVGNIYRGATAIFDFVKQASDFGSEIKDFQEKTGLGAEAITTLKFAAGQTGKSLDSLSAPLGRFTKLVGQASDGSEKATDVLKKFGLDPQTAINDLEGSLDQVIKKIQDIKNPIEQAYAAQLLFGRGGLEVVGILKNLDGGLNETIARARKLGVTLTEEDVRAADEFGDQLSLLGTQAKVTGSKFLHDFMPMITAAMGGASKAFAENQNTVRKAGSDIADTFKGLAILSQTETAKSAAAFAWWSVRMIALLDPVNANLNVLARNAGNALRAVARAGGLSAGAGLGIGVAGKAEGGLNVGSTKKFFGDLDDELTKASRSSDKIKKDLKAAAEVWTASSLSEFARASGFAVTSTTGGRHNAGSLHPLGRAVDVRTFDKTSEQITQLMIRAIQAGIRVVDERIRPTGQKVWGGPHLHLEENDRRASSFSSMMGGNQLALLKALDTERIAGKGKSVSATLRSLLEDTIKLDQEGIRKLESGVRKLQDAWENYVTPLSEIEKLQKRINELFADPEVIVAMGQYSERVQAIIKGITQAGAFQGMLDKLAGPDLTGLAEGSGLFDEIEASVEKINTELDEMYKRMGEPPPIDPWNNFWQMMQRSLEAFKESLPSIKQSLGENLINSIQGIGDVFAGAVAYWDGTAKGFFKSLAAGFRQLVQQILAELIRLLVVKAIMNAIGAIAGGIGGGGGGGGGHASIPGIGGGDIPGHFASGGFTGLGNAKDIAGFVHKKEFVMPFEAVRKYGLDIMESMRNMTFRPNLGYAGGGYTGGMMPTPSATYNNQRTWSPTIIVNVPPGVSNPAAIRQSASQGVREAMQRVRYEEQRHK